MGHLHLRARRSAEHSSGSPDAKPIESVSDNVQGILRAPPAAAVQAEVNTSPVVGRIRGGHYGRSAQISSPYWKRGSRKCDCRCRYQQISYHGTLLIVALVFY